MVGYDQCLDRLTRIAGAGRVLGLSPFLGGCESGAELMSVMSHPRVPMILWIELLADRSD